MKWVRISTLLVLVLLAMRAVSWALGWVLTRIAPSRKTVLTLAAANAFAAPWFVVPVFSRLEPGEPFDYGALLFGALVFAVYWLLDLGWTPWRREA